MIETDVLEFIETKTINNKEVFNTYYNLIEDLKSINEIHIENIPDLIRETILEDCIPFEVMEYYDEFKNDFNHNKDKVIDGFESVLNTYCEKESICCNCGEDLNYDTYSECRGEYFGFPCEEVIHEKYCPYCA